MPARRRFRGGGAGGRPTTDNGATKPAISAAHGGHAHKGAHGAPQATVTATLGGTTSSASAGHDQSGGGIGMAMLPFGMVALDRWAAKGKKTRKSKRRYRGGNGCTGGPEQGSSVGAAQGGSRRRRRRRRRQKGGAGCPYTAKGGGRRGKSHRGRRSRRVRSRRTRHRRR